MLTYSIAIRTLGTAGEKYLEELRSITRQTIQPEKVIVYIAQGFERPKEQIGNEEYVWVKKGMIAQRALPYDEISSDCVLLLDDDLLLAPDTVERMLVAMEFNQVDCVGADVYKTQNMSFQGKMYAAISNLVFPRSDDGVAFKIHRNGSFSYNNHPKSKFCLSESCAGACSLWRKNILAKIRLEDELWAEREGFWYGEDVLLFYKLYLNSGKLGILYDSGVVHLDGHSASSSHRDNLNKYYIRSKASAIIWHRTIWRLHPEWKTALAFASKQLWLFVVNCAAGIGLLKPKIPILFLGGLINAYRYCQSETYKSLPPFVIDNFKG